MASPAKALIRDLLANLSNIAFIWKSYQRQIDDGNLVLYTEFVTYQNQNCIEFVAYQNYNTAKIALHKYKIGISYGCINNQC